ncbi:MAG: PilZ domain-containing protein [Thermodesulfovibrionales bacterium]
MKKVIIAEDIQATLEKEDSFLNRSDVRIYTATTNEQVLALHRAERANLIIAQLDTPVMSGEVLSSIIRDDDELCKASLIIVVCSDTESDLKRCLQCRANAFITSPVNNAILLQEVHKLLHIGHRKSCRVPMSIKIHGRSSEIPFTGYAENLSVSGMLLHSDTLLYEGDAITCAFYLPDSTHITTNAEIIRVLERETEHDTNGYGIKFIDLSTDFSSAIEGFVKKEQRYI